MGQSASTPTETTATSTGTAAKSEPSKHAVVVTELNIYPVKSCAETGVTSAPVTASGFVGDRRFQVVAEVGGEYVVCTPRNKACEKLFHVVPALSEDGAELRLSSKHAAKDLVLNLKDAKTKTIKCATMGHEKHDLLDYGDDVAGWLEKATMIAGCRLVGMDGSFKREAKVNPDQGEALPSTSTSHPVSLADEAPFLLCSEESLAELNARLAAEGKKEVDMRRFRPNIVVKGLRPYEEDTPRRVRIGSVEFAAWQRCGRCVMTTIDRDTLARRGGEPLKTLGTYRERDHGQRNFGMHLIPVGVRGASAIKVGDKVELLEIDDDRQVEWKKKHYRWDQ